MNDVGHLYVLANSAMPGLVKVGKTTRSPAARAVELSGATGLPTQFIVVYEQLFSDCSGAESFVHTYLTAKGFRVSDNREFFNASVNEVVRVISLAPGAIHNEAFPKVEVQVVVTHGGDAKNVSDVFPGPVNASQLGDAVFDEAERHYLGLGSTLQDYQEALRLYIKAAKLGSIPAYSCIGEMYLSEQGVKYDVDVGIKYHKEGARNGNIYCYWALGLLYSRGDKDHHDDNAEKCFSRVFAKMSVDRTDDKFLTAFQRSEIIEDCISRIAGLTADNHISPSLKKIFVLNCSFIEERLREMQLESTLLTGRSNRFIEASQYYIRSIVNGDSKIAAKNDSGNV